MIGLQHLLVNTPEFADAWIDPRGRHELLVFAPAALFEAAIHHWVTLPVLAEARTRLGVRVVAGFGIGGTARQSVTLAERAATRAGQDAQPGAYLFTDTLSPSDLARTLGITDPSGRRLIRKLGEARLIVREGSTQVSRKGRPTRLYRLAITPALESVTSEPPARS
ncbi:hypothetical protein [Actinoplanes sp. NPDC051411]|uniref:hypothetical protein n=1 Tax=Actinoplanes sp. NPDC051411 TaxID=3155522 RepID=UPI0034267D7C